MPPPVDKHTHAERHMGVVPLDQLPHWTQILESAFQVSPNSAGGNKLIDVADPDDPQDAATKAYVDAAAAPLGFAYSGIGLFSVADAACQVLGNWTAGGGGAVSVQTAAGGADYTVPGASAGTSAIRLRGSSPASGFLDMASSVAPIGAGRRYLTVYAVKMIDSPGPGNLWHWLVSHMDPAVTQEDLYFGAGNLNQWVYGALYWVADADQAAGTFGGPSFIRDDIGSDPGGSADLYIGYCQTVELQDPLTGWLRHDSAGKFREAATNQGMTFATLDDLAELKVQASDTHLRATYAELGTEDGTAGLALQDSPGYWFAWAEHTPGDEANAGVNIEVGTDYVGIFISEKDAATVQMYSDLDGVDVELHDRAGGGVWIIDGGGP